MKNQENSSENPAGKYPKPPFPKQDQPVPGTEGRLRPQADHGEDSYKGSGKLKGKKAVITCSDSAPAYVFLASEDASYIAGATIPVTGGRITI